MRKNKHLDEATMRAAISDRNAEYDGKFIFAVITTGIYCRPSCSARAAKPENLRFFVDTQHAGNAGFRACKRCKPDQQSRDLNQLTELARFIEQHADQKLPLASLAQRVNLSPSYLQRVFKSTFGVSPKAYQDAARVKRLKSQLKTADTVTTAIYSAGYGSASRVYEKTGDQLGMTPKAYRNGGADEIISYVDWHSSLGPMMMAATNRGICFVMFDDSPEILLEKLRSEFPKATLCRSNKDNSQLADWMSALEAHLASGEPLPELPLDLRGTAFQIKVWNFLLSVPEGGVLSYTELAKGVNRKSAVRAVASACGKNRIAMLIPCHRVIRGDGGMGGYRWGLDRKRAILQQEQARHTNTVNG